MEDKDAEQEDVLKVIWPFFCSVVRKLNSIQYTNETNKLDVNRNVSEAYILLVKFFSSVGNERVFFILELKNSNSISMKGSIS